nr:MAG TPA: helix-turn-helix domain protein [Caudoviricetes sp.]
MTSLSERIKAVRKAAGLNQKDFGTKIGIGMSAVSLLESGTNNPSDQTLRLICSEFGISRRWLETGEGEMIDPQVSSDIQSITRTMEGQSEAKKRLVRFVVNMPPDLAEAFLAYLDSQTQKEDPRT